MPHDDVEKPAVKATPGTKENHYTVICYPTSSQHCIVQHHTNIISQAATQWEAELRSTRNNMVKNRGQPETTWWRTEVNQGQHGEEQLKTMTDSMQQFGHYTGNGCRPWEVERENMLLPCENPRGTTDHDHVQGYGWLGRLHLTAQPAWSCVTWSSLQQQQSRASCSLLNGDNNTKVMIPYVLRKISKQYNTDHTDLHYANKARKIWALKPYPLGQWQWFLTSPPPPFFLTPFPAKEQQRLLKLKQIEPG